jgi:hypothetical protein
MRALAERRRLRFSFFPLAIDEFCYGILPPKLMWRKR